MTNNHLSDAGLADRALARLEQMDPDDVEFEDPVDLRRIGLAARDIEAAQDELREAVAAARAAGRRWSDIGMVLGVSKQAAQERFGTRAATG